MLILLFSLWFHHAPSPASADAGVADAQVVDASAPVAVGPVAERGDNIVRR